MSAKHPLNTEPGAAFILDINRKTRLTVNAVAVMIRANMQKCVNKLENI